MANMLSLLLLLLLQVVRCVRPSPVLCMMRCWLQWWLHWQTWVLMAAAAAAGGALCEAISSAVYDALLAPVVAALAPLPGLPDWAGAGSGTGVMPGAGEGADTSSYSLVQVVWLIQPGVDLWVHRVCWWGIITACAG
jgi:hypothetical protein